MMKMFDIKVNDEQKRYAAEMVEKYDFGKRGYGDGTQEEQYTGILGQTVFADLVGMNRPDGSKGFDGGVDFIINGRKVDIKTMTRNVPMRQHYAHNFIAYQLKFDTEYYIFASYNKRNDILSLCGAVTKAEFVKYAKFHEKGSRIYRDDDTFFITKAPLYDILQQYLNDADSLEELIAYIK